MALLIMTSFMVNADEEYSPADYKPMVDYSEYNSSSAADFESNTPPRTEHVIKQKSVQKAVPITGIANEQTEVNPLRASISMEKPVIQNETSSQTDVVLIVVVVSILGGFVLFRRKSSSTTSSGRSSNVVPDSATMSTGVERYLEKMADNKTGVATYLERQVESAPSTGVAKYLAKQVVRDNLKN